MILMGAHATPLSNTAQSPIVQFTVALQFPLDVLPFTVGQCVEKSGEAQWAIGEGAGTRPGAGGRRPAGY